MRLFDEVGALVIVCIKACPTELVPSASIEESPFATLIIA